MNEAANNENGFQDLIRAIRRLSRSSEVNKAAIIQKLKDYISKEEDWVEYATFSDDSYTRNLVSQEDGRYNIVIMTWKTRQITRLHDHSDSCCFVKILSGALKETRYEIPQRGVPCDQIGRYIRTRDEVSYMDNTIGSHILKNECSEPAVSLHVYIPPLLRYTEFAPLHGTQEVIEMNFKTPEGKHKD